MKRSWFSRVLFVAAFAALFGGLAWLIHLRFESGRAYAHRSSLRSDPMGSKALYDAYAELPGLSVSRNFVPFVQLQELSPNASLLLLNVGGWQMHRLADYDRLTDFVDQGGRLFIALNPEQVAYEHLEDELNREREDDGVEADAEEPEETSGDRTSYTRRPGSDEKFLWEDLALRHGEHEGGEAVRAGELGVSLPDRLPWREGGVLVEFNEEVWVPLYQIDDEVVAAKRSYGSGSIVVLTDDYLFSNEALLKHRFPSLLAWVVDGQSTLIFDETHLGVAEASGVATLMRRYGLEGFVVAFAGLLALVVWRGAVPLLPPFGGRVRDQLIRSEHSMEAGLSDLLDRSLPRGAMPRRAFEAWKHSFIRNEADRRYYAAELEEIETLLNAQDSLPPRQRTPGETHSKIKSIINRKKRRRQ